MVAYILHPVCYHDTITLTLLRQVMKKKPVPTYLDEHERKILEVLAADWGCSFSSVIKRLLRERLAANTQG